MNSGCHGDFNIQCVLIRKEPEEDKKMTMLRSISWRRLCPDIVTKRIDEALAARFYILHQSGPTGFVLKEEQGSKKIKVFLGDPNMCSCAEFKKTHELCHHILWLMLKRFRVPRTNPLIWQQALVEREIDEIILGYLHRQPADQSKCSNQSHDQARIVEQREIGPEDVCPICQDNLLDSSQSTVYCRFGCGQSIHTKCMKIMADHQRTMNGERPIQCPLCREDFGSIQAEISKSSKRLRAEKASLHLGVACSHCHVCPIAGKCYRCATCICYHLCHACFSSNQIHLLHPFQSRKHSNRPWRPATRCSTLPPSDSPALPPALVSSLQSRSLTENDYELLLQLDVPSASHTHSPRGVGSPAAGRRSGHMIRVPESVVNSLHVEALDGNHPLLVGGANCQICGGEYRRGDWVRKLPCKHKFHRECLQEWLRTNSVCPVDGLSVQTTTRSRRRPARTTRDSARQRGVIPLTRALTENGEISMRGQSTKVNSQRQAKDGAVFSVSGQGISGQVNVTSSGRLATCQSDRLSLRRRGPSVSDDPLPPISHITATSLVGRTESLTHSHSSKRQLTFSIPSADNRPSVPDAKVSLAPIVTRCSQNNDLPLDRGGSLPEYSQSPLNLGGRPDDVRTISLPSIGAQTERGSVVAGSGGGKIVKGPVAHKRKSAALLVKDNRELDSLQVSSLKLCPLTDCVLTSSAPL